MKKRLDENGSKLSRFVGVTWIAPKISAALQHYGREYPGQVQLSAIRCGSSIANLLVVIG
jgi:hypothetical protein